MAVTRKSYIFGAFFLGVSCVIFILVSVSSDSWVVSSATAAAQVRDSKVQYGLFTGQLELNILITSTSNKLYMTCVSESSACAVSCKTERQAREDEVRALALGRRTNPACNSNTVIEDGPLLNPPPVISYTFYVCLLLILFLQLVFAIISTGLALLNATKNPREPILGLPGCVYCNTATALLGATALLMFGIYWATADLKTHLAFSYIALGVFTAGPSLGYSYWLLLVAIFCSLGSVALIELRKYLLEKDPPPPTIKVENHSDGTIFLY